ncbi:MAG: acyl-CoA thioesterase [Candidatus Promineofilum sp.]|nr:acyl-CoA thioesterase [Promineifilum sp.]
MNDSNHHPVPYLERQFRVRHYECDAYGHVNHANYLRYMQEAAFDASAAVGYDVARYEAIGRQWLVRETDITYLRPLAYGDTVIVKTWVADFRRVRSRRDYALRLAGSDEPVATASTEWVLLDSATLRPVTIPPEMVAAFRHPSVAAGERRDPFPTAPPPPPGIFRARRRVEWRDIDPAQHVNNANYLAYIEECNVGVAVAHGWPLSRLLAEGVGIVARRYRIEYREPAVMDDELEVTTFISDVRRATAVRHYAIRRVADGALLARAHVLWVFVDLATGQPRRIPAPFLSALAANVAE